MALKTSHNHKIKHKPQHRITSRPQRPVRYVDPITGLVTLAIGLAVVKSVLD